MGTFIVTTSQNCIAEKRYVIRWVIEEVFGLELEIVESDAARGVVFRFSENEKSLSIACPFFDQAEHQWLNPISLPESANPPVSIKSAALHLTNLTPELPQSIPILFPVTASIDQGILNQGILNEASETGIKLNLDVFGTIFFLISRYEEAIVADRDKHNRFPSHASFMGKSGLLERPIVNEYIEVLWAAMKRLWPQLKRRQRQFRILPSHDIDHPAQRWRTWGHTFSTTFQALSSGKLRQAAGAIRNRLIYTSQSIRKTWINDPFDTISWIIDQTVQNGLRSAFYYIPLKTDPVLDRGMPIKHPHVVDQWRRIHSAGHEIGIHPGYNTFQNPERIQSAFTALRRQMENLGLHQPRFGGRQHYLRWETPGTARAWNESGLDYDSTLGFADRAGFRCGTCYEFPVYDVVNRIQLRLTERPLIAMDATIISENYMGLGLTQTALDKFLDLKQQCRFYSGDFTLLWHNSSLVNEKQKEFYRSILSS